MITQTFEPLRPIYVPGDCYPHACRVILSTAWRVYYGEGCSMCYWLVPGTVNPEE